jgi:hypothetical protein
MAVMSEEILLAEVERRLISTYADFSPEQVAAAIRGAHARFEQSRIRDFVPLLVERQARSELTRASRQVLAP